MKFERSHLNICCMTFHEAEYLRKHKIFKLNLKICNPCPCCPSDTIFCAQDIYAVLCLISFNVFFADKGSELLTKCSKRKSEKCWAKKLWSWFTRLSGPGIRWGHSTKTKSGRSWKRLKSCMSLTKRRSSGLANNPIFVCFIFVNKKSLICL